MNTDCSETIKDRELGFQIEHEYLGNYSKYERGYLGNYQRYKYERGYLGNYQR